MSKYIKVLLVFIISIFSLSVIDNVSAKDYSINFYEFYGATCPHCEELNEWLENTLAKDKDYNYKYKLVRYEVWSDQTNSTLMLNVGKYLGVEVRGVPFMVIGDKSLSGFSATASPDQIKSLIDKAYTDNQLGDYKDVVKEVVDGTSSKYDDDDVVKEDEDETSSKDDDDVYSYNDLVELNTTKKQFSISTIILIVVCVVLLLIIIGLVVLIIALFRK